MNHVRGWEVRGGKKLESGDGHMGEFIIELLAEIAGEVIDFLIEKAGRKNQVKKVPDGIQDKQ